MTARTRGGRHSLRTIICDSIDEIDRGEWNRLRGADNPFLRHEFLAALEHQQCVGEQAGWLPQHLILRDSTTGLAAAMPLYLKSHSWGEFVFDWSWASAYQQLGLDYYPKLVAAVPFTPVTGPRVLVAPDFDFCDACARLIAAAQEAAARNAASSVHVLFPSDAQCPALRNAGLLLRKDCQFHWRNRGYRDFEDFLGEFSSARRKKTRRERRRVREAGIAFQILAGSELSRQDWDDIYFWCAGTFLKRGHLPYLTRSFFEELRTTMADSLVVTVARRRHSNIAAAICMRGPDALYGRYWGSAGEFHSLHFETCYYQGIDYCIREGLARFEPGAQGEYKIRRGFEPVTTWSGHWLAHPRFATAVAEYLEREGQHIEEYIAEVRTRLPFRHSAGPGQ